MRPKHSGAVLTLFATMVVIATAAHAQQNTRNFYNSHGAFAGTARTHGNATTFTDKRGRELPSLSQRPVSSTASTSEGGIYGPLDRWSEQRTTRIGERALSILQWWIWCSPTTVRA
jgi:hypothetical protein